MPSKPSTSCLAADGIPYVISREGEAVRHDDLRFAYSPEAGGPRLTYAKSDPREWDFGVLRARQGPRVGRPIYTAMNVMRQWRCMKDQLCQNCGNTAVDPATGRIWWLLADEGDSSADTGWASAPPICRSCVPRAIALCPHLRKHAALYSVGGSEPWAVLAHEFKPASVSDMSAVLVRRHVMIDLQEFDRLCNALALELRVVLWDLVRAPIP